MRGDTDYYGVDVGGGSGPCAPQGDYHGDGAAGNAAGDGHSYDRDDGDGGQRYRDNTEPRQTGDGPSGEH
jgi:hypothetical protein